MRQQYHSRYLNDDRTQDRYVWDVTKLVHLAKKLPVQEVPLSQIKELEENYWFDDPDKGPPPVCKSIAEHARLINDCDLQYPIILCPKGRVMDGMHRVCKAYIQGHKSIKAVQFDKQPEPHYINVSLDDLPYND